jgi:hypothetical protein
MLLEVHIRRLCDKIAAALGTLLQSHFIAALCAINGFALRAFDERSRRFSRVELPRERCAEGFRLCAAPGTGGYLPDLLQGLLQFLRHPFRGRFAFLCGKNLPCFLEFLYRNPIRSIRRAQDEHPVPIHGKKAPSVAEVGGNLKNVPSFLRQEQQRPYREELPDSGYDPPEQKQGDDTAEYLPDGLNVVNIRYDAVYEERAQGHIQNADEQTDKKTDEFA